MDKSTTFHSDPKAATYRNDLTEIIDPLRRTTSVKGTVADSSGETTVVDRTYTYQANGYATVADKSNTTHKAPAAITYALDLIEEIDPLGRSTGVRGTITSSDGRKVKVNRQYRYKRDGSSETIDE